MVNVTGTFLIGLIASTTAPGGRMWMSVPARRGEIKTGSSSQGVTVRTRGIFGISTTVGFRGFSSSSLYLAGTEICWAPVKEHLQMACVRNRLRNLPQPNHAGSPLSSTRQESINFRHGLISADNVL